jgi:futalosine hydrolase
MKILIVSATHKEIAVCKQLIGEVHGADANTFEWERHTLTFLVTGVGLLATAFALGNTNLRAYDWIFNIGVAGSFNKEWQLAQVVQVVSEEVEGFGISSSSGFRNMFSTDFVNSDEFPYSKGKLHAPDNMGQYTEYLSLPKAKGLTSNTVHGREEDIAFLENYYRADIETQESAAFFYACTLHKCEHWLAFRGISNYVEPRNREAWKLEEAIVASNRQLVAFLSKLNDHT